MKFALLGSDVESLALSEAAVAAGHDLVWVGDIQKTAIAGKPKPDGPPSWLPAWTEQSTDDLCWAGHDEGSPVNWQRQSDWQVLLDRQTVDVVIVGRGQAQPEVRAEQLVSLAKQGVPVLSTHPIVPSVLSYFEIDMSRDESGALFRCYHPTTEHPVVEQLAAWVRQGHPQLGKVQQIVCQRRLAERTRESVLWHFSRDVLLLARVGGRINRLGALGTPLGEATYAALNVQMIGKLERPIHWSVGPEDRSAGLQLALVGQQGRLLLQLDETGQPHQLGLHISGEQTELPLDLANFDPTTDAVESTCKILWNARSVATQPTQDAERQTAVIDTYQDRSRWANHSTWREALLAMELTDTIEISLRRGRLIDVHHQPLTEQMAFKGMMSAIGCGRLIVLPMLLLGIGWIMGVLGLSIASYWPHALLLLLGLFLALQALPWLLYSKQKPAAKVLEDEKEY
jgi:hypothetical protein